MSMNIEKIIELNELASTKSRKKHVIILNPEEEYKGIDNYEKNVDYEFDKSTWEISEGIQELVEQLSQNTMLSNEDKVLKIYERLCMDYTYDDNLISYIRRVDEESFLLPDWYAREVGDEWKKNREKHNRRVCYEVSRYLAKALQDLFKDNENYNITILWDKNLTHYFVAMSCDDYSITLDLDDFNNIKDLTRVKAGLTAEGIKILEDKKGKFYGALDRFNEGKSKDAIKKLEHDMVYYTDELQLNGKNQSSELQYPDDVLYFKNAIEIFQNKYGVDSQGLYECLKEIIDIKLGPDKRDKPWKKIKDDNENVRHIRCLILKVDNNEYIIDVEEGILRPFDIKEFEKDEPEFIPYKNLTNEDLVKYRVQNDRYDG